MCLGVPKARGNKVLTSGHTNDLKCNPHSRICSISNASTMGEPFLTLEDLKVAFSIFCCVCGVGTLSLPKNYASAGFGWASAALVYMALINTYATVCISKLLLDAPRNVRTFADLGEFSMGKFGRWAILITQMLNCILVPIVLLVLGGSLAVILFPGSYGESTWIIATGVALLPICLIPTLKEGAFAAAAGALGTVVASAIALYLLLDNMLPIPDGVGIPSPDVGFKQVASVFGSLALAYGAGIVIPALQREHSEPQRMPKVILVTMVVISLFFLAVAVIGVSVLGCQVPGNLIFSIAGSPTALGFTANRGGVIFSALFMYMHVAVAFAVIINPAYYTMERLILGLHKHNDTKLEIEGGFQSVATPNNNNEDVKMSTMTLADEDHDLDSKTYQAPGVYPKVAALRIIVVAACIAIACVWKDHLSDLLDFAGACCVSVCCMILPMLFYVKQFWRSLSKIELAWAITSIVVCTCLAVYETYENGKPLFNPKPSNPAIKFAYCPAGSSYQRMVYTNVSYHANYTRTTAL
ncbi:hypothetical protein AeMF1_014411 [Aphanomyces euteiches]|nr:hypothetical protein AeMF1_014411 [Aphanomyces euteiches]KAH9183403.1 hypothetical protein AeNC1_014620 [Aphanomyces euteiches]